MATAFDTFNQYAFGQYDGQIEDRQFADIVSVIATEGSGGLMYGRAVQSEGYRKGRHVAEGGAPFGIVARETVRDNEAGDNPDTVVGEGRAASVVRVGRIWATTVDGAADGDSVYVVPGTGELTNTANADANILFPNAKWRTDADAEGRALIQLNGAA